MMVSAQKFGVAFSCACFVSVIIGLSVPRIWIHSRNYTSWGVSTESFVGIKHVQAVLYEMDGKDELEIDTSDLWESRNHLEEFDEYYHEPVARPHTQMVDFFIAAFAFFLVGLFANAAQCTVFLSEYVYGPQSKARKAAIGTGVIMSVSYMIGSACAIGGSMNMMHHIEWSDNDEIEARLGVSSALFIVACIGSTLTIVLACSWRCSNEPPTKDGASTGKNEANTAVVAEGNVEDAPMQGFAACV